MEAMTLGYPPEQAGQISVTATKEEWHELFYHESWEMEKRIKALLLANGVDVS